MQSLYERKPVSNFTRPHPLQSPWIPGRPPELCEVVFPSSPETFISNPLNQKHLNARALGRNSKEAERSIGM